MEHATTARWMTTKRVFLALTLALATLLVAAVPAMAQRGPVTATGVLVGPVEDNDPDPTPEYRLTDEATGTTYVIVSGFVDLDPFAGQRVTIAGAPIGGADYAPPALNVTHIEPAGGTVDGKTVTATFALTVECPPPAGTEFTASIGQGPAAAGALLDQDGDGVYVTSLPVERGTEQGARIERLDPISEEPQAPLVATTIKDFGSVTFDEDKSFSASVSFCGDGDTGASNGDAVKSSGGGTKVLPATGGVLPIAGLAGALLVGGGLLMRRLAR